jgi:RNA polymerase sigma-70 factor, ECF subfamily
MRASDVEVIGPPPVHGRQGRFGGGCARGDNNPGGSAPQHPQTDSADAERMRTLYVNHAAALCRYATRLTGDRAHAEDVVQETLVRAWQRPQIVDDTESSARAWLFTVARNIIVDDRRSARSRNEICSLDGSAPEPVGPDDADAALDRLLIAAALARLSPEHLAVVRRSYFLGWTMAHIANDLHIAEGTVKSRLHYALAALRLTLQEMHVMQ